MVGADDRRRANRRLGLTLAGVALLFALAYVAKVVWFGA
jgi:hypothetical protein